MSDEKQSTEVRTMAEALREIIRASRKGGHRVQGGSYIRFREIIGIAEEALKEAGQARF